MAFIHQHSHQTRSQMGGRIKCIPHHSWRSPNSHQIVTPWKLELLYLWTICHFHGKTMLFLSLSGNIPWNLGLPRPQWVPRSASRRTKWCSRCCPLHMASPWARFPKDMSWNNGDTYGTSTEYIYIYDIYWHIWWFNMICKIIYTVYIYDLTTNTRDFSWNFKWGYIMDYWDIVVQQNLLMKQPPHFDDSTHRLVFSSPVSQVFSGWSAIELGGPTASYSSPASISYLW